MDNDEYTRLYVAKHIVTGLYDSRILHFLNGGHDWIRHANVDIVKLEIANAHRSFWTDDLQSACTWQIYYMKMYEKYLTDIEFVPAKERKYPDHAEHSYNQWLTLYPESTTIAELMRYDMLFHEGGKDSTSFKIKRKKLIQQGKKLLKRFTS